jgi:putative flippase GtrA
MTAFTAPLAIPIRAESARRLMTFGVIGVASTLAYVALYAWLRQGVSAGLANAVALLATAVGNTAANRRLTFDVRGRSGLARDHAAGLAALGVALAITSASLGLLDALAPHHGRTTELVVLVRSALRAGHAAVPVHARPSR